MSDYLFCVSNPQQPGLVQILSSRDDPRIDQRNPYRTQRNVGAYTLEWTLRVVNGTLSETALKSGLKRQRSRDFKDWFECNPHKARGIAIELTTLRPEDPRARKLARRGLLSRILPFRRRAA